MMSILTLLRILVLLLDQSVWVFCVFFSMVLVVLLTVPYFFPQQIQFNDEKQEFNKRPNKTTHRSMPRSTSQSSTDSLSSGLI